MLRDLTNASSSAKLEKVIHPLYSHFSPIKMSIDTHADVRHRDV